MIGTLGWTIVAALAFVGGHLALSSAVLRPRLIELLGENGFRIVYSAVALVTLVWLMRAAGAAPVVSLWPETAWARWVPILVMPFALVLLVAGVTTPSPTAMGGAARDDGPTGLTATGLTGILAVTRHPVMWAVALWALAHIPPNGEAARVVMFVAFAALALGGMVHIDHRRAAAMGAAWGPIALTTSALPFAALAAGRARFAWRALGAWRVLAGLALYADLFLGHPWIAGVPVFPALPA